MAAAQLGSVDDIKEKLAQMQTALTDSHPLIPSLLRTIHQQLKADPEIVTLLSEEEINIVVRGLEHQAKVHLVQSITSTGTRKKSLKNLDLDDF